MLVLKQFLYMRNLNEVWKGGISSYCLTLMVISFLQNHIRPDEANSPYANLGVLLIEFFELYGYLFNYLKVGISTREGRYMKKEQILKNTGGARSILCVEDPTNNTNDVGRSSYNALKVQLAFRLAYHDLSKACCPTATYMKPNVSILGRIVRVSREDDEKHRRHYEQVETTTFSNRKEHLKMKFNYA